MSTRATPLILLVDDDADFLEIVSLKLRSEGYEVVIARNGAEGVRQAEKLLPDLILMDIHMPGSTGTDAALAIKQNAKLKGLRVAFLSSLQDPWPAMGGDKEKISQELGMENYLSKTDDLNALMAQIKKILSTNVVSPPAQ